MATGANPKIWTRDTALAVLRELLPELKARYGVERIGVFGSVARNEAGPESDVDVVVHLRQPDLFALGSILELLETRFDRHVDLTRQRTAMDRSLAEKLKDEAVYYDE